MRGKVAERAEAARQPGQPERTGRHAAGDTRGAYDAEVAGVASARC